MFETIDACPKPVIARVNGHALGGGVGLVACADIAIAVSGASFGLTEVRLGLIPAVISPYVLRAVGPGHTRALFASGRRFDADEACGWAWCTGWSTPADLDAGGCRVRRRPAARRPGRDRREQAAGARRHRRRWRCPTCRSGWPPCGPAREAQEGLTAFLEKRDPSWTSGGS